MKPNLPQFLANFILDFLLNLLSIYGLVIYNGSITVNHQILSHLPSKNRLKSGKKQQKFPRNKSKEFSETLTYTKFNVKVHEISCKKTRNFM